ncbi:MAG: flagellin [Paracoccaceae bacterium]|nr:flagellin [Paracoccaceae bacterium]
MASILTNTSAMVALQNLRTINNDLEETQNQISTGKEIATAKDNSAIWAVSKVIESDVNSFESISDSLNLGDSTVAVARDAAETVTDILTELKGNIVAAQEENVDRTKIQADIDAQIEQVQSIVSAASFNGLSLVEGTEDVTILGSLQRDAAGNVTASEIDISRQDLTTQAGQLSTSGDDLSANVTATSSTLSADAVRDDGAASPTAADIVLAGDLSDGAVSFDVGGTVINFAAGELDATAATAGDQIAAAINAAGIDGISVVNNAGTLEFASTRAFEETVVSATSAATGTVGGGANASVTLDERAETFTFSGAAVNEGDGYQFAFGGVVATYVAGQGETMEDVANGLKLQIDAANDPNITTQVVQNGTQWELKIDNSSATDATVTVVARNDNSGDAVVTGGLAGLEGIDVTTDEGASAALENIDTLIDTSIDAAASFGSDQSRIELQSEFISKLTDSLNAGIGSLVDADLEAASARLQALQVQQELGTQALSIANQAPQSILSLFQ